jgi:hypothetical protein
MITIGKNINFSNWFDIRFFGKLVDNAKTMAMAMKIANNIKAQEKAKGNNTQIKNLVRKSDRFAI